MPELPHPLGKVLRQRFFPAEEVGGAGDIYPHDVWRGERNGSAVAERDVCQAAERSLDLRAFDLDDDQLRNERRRFGDGLLGAHTETLCLAIDGSEWLGSG